MAVTTLDDFIKDLEEVKKSSFYKEEIKDIMNAIMREIIKAQIYDTNYSRKLFIKATMTALGSDNSDMLKEAINFWYNGGRQKGGIEKSIFTDKAGNYVFDMVIDSYAIANQEEGKPNYPSRDIKLGTIRDSSKFLKYHITDVCDRANVGSLKEVEKKINKLVNKFVRKLG